MRFPKREPDIARLAHDLVNGLRANAEDFPSPPVSPDQLQQTLDTYNVAREAAITRYAHSVSGTQEKDEAVDALIDVGFEVLSRHARLVSAPINTIEDSAGGSVRCMIAEIHLPHRD